jgi:hypothetical protein
VPQKIVPWLESIDGLFSCKNDKSETMNMKSSQELSTEATTTANLVQTVLSSKKTALQVTANAPVPITTKIRVPIPMPIPGLRCEPPNVLHRLSAKDTKKLLGLPPNAHQLDYWHSKGLIYAVSLSGNKDRGNKHLLYSITQDDIDRAAKLVKNSGQTDKENKTADNGPNASLHGALPVTQPNTVSNPEPDPNHLDSHQNYAEEVQTCMDRVTRATKVKEMLRLEHEAAYTEMNKMFAEVQKCSRALRDAQEKHLNAEDRACDAQDKTVTSMRTVNDAKRALNAVKRKRI